MTPSTLDKLRVIIGVALAMVPYPLRRAFAEKPTAISDPAKREIAERIAADVDQMFEVEAKPPPPYGPSLHSRAMAPSNADRSDDSAGGPEDGRGPC